MNGSKSKSRGRGSLNEVRPRRPEQCGEKFGPYLGRIVSMKSGLEGRNNPSSGRARTLQQLVSMKSGLEGRNNPGVIPERSRPHSVVSMKSGLEGRNNAGVTAEVRGHILVSMKSGLEGRNNAAITQSS